MKAMTQQKVCIVCGKESSKYKCPTCRSAYCSVDCCKAHKQDPNCQPAPSISRDAEPIRQDKTPSDVNFSTEDTVPEDKLQLLGKDERLRNLLANPHLQHLLKSVDCAPNASRMMEDAMQEPIFVEFADLCLGLVENKPEV